MSAFRRMMSYLGLVDDDEYEEYDGYEEPQTAARPSRPTALAEPPDAMASSIRTLPREAEMQPSAVSVAPRPSGVVRPIMPVASAKPFTVTPASFQDCKEIGDRLKAGVPVIVNLQSADRDLLRRIIDFSSGLTYGIGAEMERTADRVYLLTPTTRG